MNQPGLAAVSNSVRHSKHKRFWNWAGQKINFFRDFTTFLAVIFAAALAGWLTGGNPLLPFPKSEIVTHPYLTPVVGVSGFVLVISTTVLLILDLATFPDQQEKQSRVLRLKCGEVAP
jgi:hypothetical protein